jgi:4-amino-4-deoxy-L-arabinose transferase-like glycosyltransferase
MSNSRPVTAAPRRDLLPACVIALAYFLLLMLTSTRYGYFRDALYYLACSHHLAWGYVDQPPLIVFLAWMVRHTIGTSLPALLFLPALAGAARILFTGYFARELGAGRLGCSVAAVLSASSGVWHVIDHQFAMNAFEPLFWTGCAFVILRMIKTNNARLWLWFGLISGLGLENKYSMAAFALCLLAAMLATSARKFLLSPWMLAGGAVAMVIFLPNLLWNIQHHWPFLELMHNIRQSGRDIVLSPSAFLWQQILIMGLTGFPVWITGLIWYLFAKEARAYRALGWAFVFTVLFFLLAHGKNYYSAPVYPLIFAAAGVAVERFTTRMAGRWASLTRRILKPGVFVLPAVGVAVLLPVTLPVLSLNAYLRYQSHLPFAIPRSEHSHLASALPQHYADEFGWIEMTQAAARAYHSLTPAQQAETAIFGNDYGQAAAIDFFGPKYGLPRAISGHQSYFLWGPRNYTGAIVIVLGGDYESTARHFASCKIVPTEDNPYALERKPVLLCFGLKESLQTIWPKLKHWD